MSPLSEVIRWYEPPTRGRAAGRALRKRSSSDCPPGRQGFRRAGRRGSRSTPSQARLEVRGELAQLDACGVRLPTDARVGTFDSYGGFILRSRFSSLSSPGVFYA